MFLPLAVAVIATGCAGDDSGTPDDSLPAIATARADASTQVDRPDVDAYVQAQLASQHIPGLSLAVMHAGQIVYAKGYGYADPATRAPMRPELRFDLASISKQFLAEATMMLVEQGALGLDDKIATYLGADGPRGWTDITIRHLLSHTAGIDDLPDAGFFTSIDAPGATTEAAMLANFRAYPLVFAPGTRWAYSDMGYDILGFIVSKVTGGFYLDFEQDHIFTPLGMTSVRFMSAHNTLDGTSGGFGLTGKNWTPIVMDAGVQDYLSTGSSGLQMSTLDIAKWDAALDAGTLLTPASQLQMWTPAPAADIPPNTYDWGTTYGFGWFLQTLDNGEHVVSHSGGLPGYTHELIRYRDTRWSVVVLTNLDEDLTDPETIAQQVGTLFGATQ
jgi:CubicO group peptidase (beta-lactamase class C family)